MLLLLASSVRVEDGDTCVSSFEGMGETFEFNKVLLKLKKMFSTFFEYFIQGVTVTVHRVFRTQFHVSHSVLEPGWK